LAQIRVRTPLLWAASAAALGVVAGIGVPFAWWMAPLCGVTLCLTWLCLRWSRAAWPALLACCFLLCFCWTSLRARIPALPPEGQGFVTGRVVTEPRVKPNAANMYLADAQWTVDGNTYAIPGKLWLRYTSYDEELGPLPEPGQIVRAEARVTIPQGQRNPGGFDFRAYLQREGAYMAAYTYRPMEITGQSASGPGIWLQRLRGTVSRRMDVLFGPHAPVIRGMLIGEKQDISNEEMQSFRRSGIAHLLAVSGLHVGFVALPLMGLAKKLKLSGWPRLLMLGLPLLFYCLLVGAPPGTVRACGMLMLVQAAPEARRRYESLSALAAVFWGMLVINPLSLWGPGLLLSCSAVLGISLFYGRFKRFLHRLPKWLASSLAVSMAAQLGTLPLVAAYFNEVSLLGLLTNLAAVPIAGAVVMAGLLATLLDFVWAPLAYPLALLVRACAVALKFLSDTVAAVPFATVRVATPPWYVVAACYGAIALMGEIVSLGKRWRKWAVSGLGLVVTLGLSALLTWHGPQYAQLDVGQGDAAVLRVNGFTAVVDTGNQGSGALADYLRHEGLAVDALFLSHPHGDHAGALLDLVEEGVPIRKIWMTGDLAAEQIDDASYAGLMAAAQGGIPIEPLSAGERLELASGLTVEALHPLAQSQARDINDLSLALMFDIGGVRLLTTGDVTSVAEPLRGVDCDILKVSHHGSRYSTGPAFLRATSPALALISVGHNDFGHPAPIVLDNLHEVGARVLRTDQTGAITIRFDPQEPRKITVHTFLLYEGSQL